MRNKPDYFYDQSAVIPFRRQGGAIEVLMISSRKKKRWVIPKGIKEPELSAADSAAKEALEEAGIEGHVAAIPVGTYTYRKWGGTCTVEVFAMAVEKMLPIWEESYRERQWVTLEEARERVREKGLKAILQSLPEHLAG